VSGFLFVVPFTLALSPPSLRSRGICAPPVAVRSRSHMLSTYAAEAAGLFANMGGASAFIAGGLVPLATFASPQPAKEDSVLIRRLKRAHAVLSSCSLVSMLIAVQYATISTNKLRETSVAATASLKALLVEGEFALPWIGCNSYFVLGLCGFAATVGLNVWLTFGRTLGKAVGFIVASALFLMISIVNEGIAAPGAMGVRVGGSVVSLIARYVALLLHSMVDSRRVLVLGSVACACTGGLLAAMELLNSTTEDLE